MPFPPCPHVQVRLAQMHVRDLSSSMQAAAAEREAAQARAAEAERRQGESDGECRV